MIVVADPSGFHMLVSQGRGQLDKYKSKYKYKYKYNWTNTMSVVADPSGFHMLVSQGRGQLDKETPSVRTHSKGTAAHQSVGYNILTEY